MTLKEKLNHSGMRMDFVAEKVGVAYTTFSKILNGKQPYVSPDLAQRLHEYLDRKIVENNIELE